MYNGPPKRVLVVEDDVDYRKMLQKALYMEYEIVEAENGEQAMEKILVHEPHLVILDLLLPKVDGFEVLERIRNYPDPKVSQLPVVILSNLSSNRDTLEAQSLKIEAYCVKSATTMEDLQWQLKQIIQARYPEKEKGA